MTPTKVIFDTDPGIDDAMAILFAHHSKAIDLMGITTVLGNASIETVTNNALYLCEKFSINSEVYQGAADALWVDREAPPAFVHGEDGLGNINAAIPRKQANQLSAVQYIVDTITANPHEITLIAVGRLTNLAIALRTNPAIANLVKEVIVMGGALGSNEHTGNVTAVAEANIYGDPHAADIVLSADWPLTLVGLDVTMQCVMKSAAVATLRETAGQTGEFIWDITRHYEDFYQRTRGVKGFPVHDSCAVAYIIAPELFTVRRGSLRVAVEGICRGQTILVPEGRQFPPGAWDGISISNGCVGVDADGLLDLYHQTLTHQN